MRKAVSLALALILLFALGVTAGAKNSEDKLQTISCPEQGFSVQCADAYKWKYSAREGITIYTQREGSIPYVLVYYDEDWLVDVADYIREQEEPHFKKQYGADLISSKVYDHYTLGGRDVAAGVYSYKLQGYTIDMIRAFEVQDRRTVVYTAKYIHGKDTVTPKALEQAVASFRPDPDYYAALAENTRWKNTVTTAKDGSILYTFKDVTLTLPADWAGLYNVKITDKSISFYHAMSRRLWNEKNGSDGGLLFSLCWSAKKDYDYLPSYADIGKGESGYYYFYFPTDVQAFNTKMAMEEYSGMWKQIEFIKKNAATTAPAAAKKKK